MIHFQGKIYEVVKEYRNGWNLEAFRTRYNEVLDRYDYVVGDWGYNQLRLKGFFKESSPRATKESSIANLQDYLNEYCNFGCAHFVIMKVGTSSSSDPEGETGASDTDGPTAANEASDDVVQSDTAAAASGPADSQQATPHAERPQQNQPRKRNRYRGHHRNNKPGNK